MAQIIQTSIRHTTSKARSFFEHLFKIDSKTSPWSRMQQRKREKYNAIGTIYLLREETVEFRHL